VYVLSDTRSEGFRESLVGNGITYGIRDPLHYRNRATLVGGRI
jgi:hypothetical protein